MEGSSYSYELEDASYGKDQIRLIASVSDDGRDRARELSFAVTVSGRFEDAYRSGENSAILPSDTLRRHVLATVAAQPDAALESLAAAAGGAILAANVAFDTVVVRAEERGWGRIGQHSFVCQGRPLTATARCSRSSGIELAGSVAGLAFLATRGSAFTGFISDPLTVQQEALDRPLCGTLDASWTFATGHVPEPGSGGEIVSAIERAFSDRPSNAVQELITAAGAQLLAQRPELASATLRFASLSLAPLAPALRAGGDGGAEVHEIGAGPVGLTDVTVRRSLTGAQIAVGFGHAADPI
jgi:urate oxidase